MGETGLEPADVADLGGQEAEVVPEQSRKKQRQMTDRDHAVDQNNKAGIEEDDVGGRETIHDLADEELDASGMPTGWVSCPKMATAPVWRFIPMKVPLGAAFNNLIPDPKDRFTVEDAIGMAKGLLANVKVPVVEMSPDGRPVQILKDAECTMVIDLTNSNRYYRRQTWEDNGFYHLKIPNRGRGEVPAAQAVNDFVFEVQSYINANPAGYILVHCTHGFNRTGYMIVSHLMRMLSDETTTVEKAVQLFAQSRSPGIYKGYYIKSLFRYYHMKEPDNYPEPVVPDWKAGASDDDDDDQDDAILDADPCEGDALQHDDVLGEDVCQSEANWVRGLLMQYIMGRSVEPNGEGAMFPGSQPVSLARSNLGMLSERRYWVTWKADGTRYLILLHRAGTYLIDRSNAVRRVQMRWPSPLPPADPTNKQPPRAPIGGLHQGTILDGEMVVDEDLVTGKRTRRFLAYDSMVINGEIVTQRPWIDRWNYIDKFIEAPRRLEATVISNGKWKMRYDYSKECFRFRRKMFWPLSASKKIIDDFIPRQLTHEADGLILQPHDDPYAPLTCHELLKWKFAHMNSVDFRLRIDQEGNLHLQLLHPTKHGAATVKDLPGAKVTFPEGENHLAYEGKIIECTWDEEAQSWAFMRDRKDKTLPNAESVYHKVWASIEDNIQETDLIDAINTSLKSRIYDSDRK
jgi:mRNA-capping enzyme